MERDVIAAPDDDTVTYLDNWARHRPAGRSM